MCVKYTKKKKMHSIEKISSCHYLNIINFTRDNPGYIFATAEINGRVGTATCYA